MKSLALKYPPSKKLSTERSEVKWMMDREREKKSKRFQKVKRLWLHVWKQLNSFTTFQSYFVFLLIVSHSVWNGTKVVEDESEGRRFQKYDHEECWVNVERSPCFIKKLFTINFSLNTIMKSGKRGKTDLRRSVQRGGKSRKTKKSFSYSNLFNFHSNSRSFSGSD